MALRERGFTLIELMIVVAIVAIIAAIAIPNLIEARKAANEGSAMGTLRAITAAQNLFRDRDMNMDGRNEFAMVIGDLVQARLIAMDVAFVPEHAGPYAYRSGYYFGIFRRGGTPIGEGYWAIATPASFGRSGDRTFAVGEEGVITFTTTAVNFSASPSALGWDTAQ